MSKEMEALKDQMRANFTEQLKISQETVAIAITKEQKKYENMLLEKQVEVEKYVKESEKNKKQLDEVTSELKENKAELDSSTRCLLAKSEHEIVLKKKKQDLNNTLKISKQKVALLAKQLETQRQENQNLMKQFKEERQNAKRQKEPAVIQRKFKDEKDVPLNAVFLNSLQSLLFEESQAQISDFMWLLTENIMPQLDGMDTKNKNIQTYQNGQISLEANIRTLKNQIPTNMERLEDQIIVLVEDYESQNRQKIKNLEGSVRNIAVVLDSTKQQLQRTEDKLSQANQKIISLQDIRSQEYHEYKQLSDVMREENRRLKDVFETANTEKNRLTEENFELKNRCSDSNQNMSRMKEECKSLTNHSAQVISELEKQIREQKEQIQSLEKVLDNNQDIEQNICQKFLDIAQLPNLSDEEKIQISSQTANSINATVQKAKDYFKDV